MKPSENTCQWSGCAEAGAYPAPRRRQMPVSYESPISAADDVPLERDFYCLAHIKEFNKNWNFFSGMTQAEIEQFQKDAITGHRRTKKIQPHVVEQGYRKAEAFKAGHSYTKPTAPIADIPLTPETRDALAIFGLDLPVSKDNVKQRYRELVKQYHPDRAGAAGQEKIKSINQAYTCLKAVCV